jgi:hypothetical protein
MSAKECVSDLRIIFDAARKLLPILEELLGHDYPSVEHSIISDTDSEPGSSDDEEPYCPHSADMRSVIKLLLRPMYVTIVF